MKSPHTGEKYAIDEQAENLSFSQISISLGSHTVDALMIIRIDSRLITLLGTPNAVLELGLYWFTWSCSQIAYCHCDHLIKLS